MTDLMTELSDDDLLGNVEDTASANKILEGLNDSQEQAVSAPLSNMLVIAGAGTGKTRVLVSRIAWLIKKEQIQPRNILAVTFTNKAAGEMRDRIALMAGEIVEKQLWASTFHSICLRLLRNYARYAGLEPNFTVLDSDSQTTLIKRIMKEFEFDIKELKPSDVASRISKLKEQGIRAPAYATRGKRFDDPDYEKISRIYTAYERICNQENSADFSELLLRTVELLEVNDEVRNLQHRRFKEILVDEFQDTNSIQYRFLKLMTAPTSHIMVVGDDDQSIYGWRGADYTNMKKFLNDFKDVKEYLLALNYRSSQKILDIANTLIAKNTDRLMEKVLKANNGTGETVKILNCANNNYEADIVGKTIAKLHQEEGIKYRDIAILYRNNYLSLGFEQSLSNCRIPFIIYGGQKFFDRAEILDALAYLRLLVNEDDDTAAMRVINVPARKIGPKVVADLRAICEERSCSMIKAIKLLSAYVQQDGADKTLKTLYKKVESFYQLINYLKENKAQKSLSELVDLTIQASGLQEMYALKDTKEGKSGEDNSRVSNLGVLVSNVKDFEIAFAKEKEDGVLKDENALITDDPLLTYLSNITLVSTSELDEEGKNSSENVADAVNMMTIHASKGLEFKYVFLVGFENTILPSKRSLEFGGKQLTEERRLAYVGITRAKQDLYITYSQNRSLFGSTNTTGASPFLREVVKAYNSSQEKPYAIIPINYQTMD